MARTQVSFATCNLYNLNEPGLRTYRDENGWSQEEYDRKLGWTAQVMTNIQADVWAFQTHVFNKTRESLDHILVSQEFYDNSRNRLWAFKGMEITNDHLNSDDHKETGSSDHGIVCATFEYRPA